MKILILGTGHIGKALAATLRKHGHQVAGTTTTPAKVAGLESLLDEVHVLRGSDSAAMAAAAQDCDAIVVTVAPNWKTTATAAQRELQYREVLVESCDNAAASCPRVIFCSSFSVYGDGGDGQSAIDESTATSDDDEPSTRYYQQAEQAVLANAQGAVLRFPDMYGAPGDMTYPQRVAASHQYFDGKTVFGDKPPLYTIHAEDVVRAIDHAISADLSGVYNVCDNDTVPYSNQQVFDAICAQEGLQPLQFLNQIKAPLRKISASKLYATGFRVLHGDPNASVVENHLGQA
jgi:nucleoside-diphosphate-sugar epimerase